MRLQECEILGAKKGARACMGRMPWGARISAVHRARFRFLSRSLQA
jgi:hypothetical protein